jgi:hypothetical protein
MVWALDMEKWYGGPWIWKMVWALDMEKWYGPWIWIRKLAMENGHA